MLQAAFDAFLLERNVHLTLTQQRVAALLWDAAEQDDGIMDLLSLPGTGASFLFGLLDQFTTSRKVLTRPDQVMTDEDWQAAYDALKRRANTSITS